MNSVCVIGSINIDVVLQVQSCPDAGQSIYAHDVLHTFGGKGANAALALKKLNAHTAFLGCVGQDEQGRMALQNLQNFGVDTAHILQKTVPTGTAYVILEDNSENRIIVAPGANEAITATDIRTFATPLIRKSDLVLIQLEIATAAIEEIIAICNESQKRLVVDAGPIRGIQMGQLKNIFCLSPNRTELEALVGRTLQGQDEIQQAAKELLEFGVEQVLVKMGANGCIFVSREYCFTQSAYPVKTVDTTAAGDSFMAGYCKALATNCDIVTAIDFATKCGAVAVTRLGAAPSLPTLDEIENFSLLFT